MNRYDKNAYFCILILIFLLTLLSGCTLAVERKAAVPELIEPVSVELDLFEVKRGTLALEMRGTGIIVPSATDYYSFEIDGELGQWFVRPGDIVHKGDVLVRLDSGNFDMQLLQQQLAVENRQRALNQELEAGLDEANTDNLWLLRTNLRIEQMKLDLLLDRQSKRELKALTDGIVTFADSIREGDQVISYQPVAGIAQTDRLQLRYIGDLSSHLSNLKLGISAVLTDQDGSLKTKGVVASLPMGSANASNSSRAAILEKTLLFDFENELPDSIQLGDNLEFALELVRKENALIIPRGALRNYQGRDFVLVVDGETSRELDVERGLVTPTEVEIVAGLAEGQLVVVTN
ncbi:efflux RND transporter periplasmic adaptor subunit [Paenibacillus sp. PAMC21692]|uniref:efflux RND transporter periplasmic adaptor subunit n=1 Tax=Paenibacillus sp. PAMC21692 TaxID=2762320 RepID=UPI00164E0BE8|nr:biotin/lipoyl-binding protein [Paenibacillus sp. PAMC21692]QNK60229.1 biotin/lipoyl-binding protein [Paenibacillus sp. PAMC21692]